MDTLGRSWCGLSGFAVCSLGNSVCCFGGSSRWTFSLSPLLMRDHCRMYESSPERGCFPGWAEIDLDVFSSTARVSELSAPRLADGIFETFSVGFSEKLGIRRSCPARLRRLGELLPSYMLREGLKRTKSGGKDVSERQISF